MNCGECTVKYLLFIFNFVFTLCGLILIVPAAYVYANIKDVPDKLQDEASILIIGVLVVGCIVFVVAFFGCCGAIKESHCMIITFAVLLLTILVIQVGIAIAAFVKIKGFDRKSFDAAYAHEFDQYWTKDISKGIIDFTQTTFACCGVDSSNDFSTHPHMNGTIPRSCCPLNNEEQLEVCPADKIFKDGCSKRLFEFFYLAGKILGSIALGIAGVELIGIIFALCLANSIRNADRRAYRV